MKKYILYIIAAAALLFCNAGPLFSQSTIKGIVKSGPGGTPIEGAAITIGGDLVGLTDATGNYSFGIASGTNTLAATYNGNTISKTITFAPGNNWMNFWFDPPALPSDFDGNYYQTVVIGTQTWMAENLTVTHFRDGTNIPNVTDNTAWSNLTTNAYCWYNNDFATYKNTYGALYNWYTVNTVNLCPIGWKVPDDEEWTILTDYLGGTSVAGGKLKEAGTLNWNSPNTGATNESGFTGRPGGVFDNLGNFNGLGSYGGWWTSGGYTTNAPMRFLNYDVTSVGVNNLDKKNGFSVRCIQIIQPTLTTQSIDTITQITAKSGGNVSNNGGSLVTACGVCWSTSSNPTVLDNHTTENSIGAGNFWSSLTGLSPNTTYYVRAYATNIVGTAYGNELSFTTYKSDAITDNEGNYYNIVKIGSQNWMAENLRVRHYNNGDNILTTYPAVTDISAEASPEYQWSYKDALLELPVQIQPLITAGVGGLTFTQLVAGGYITTNQATVLENWATSLAITNANNKSIQTINDECKGISATIPQISGLLYTWFVVADGSRKVCPSGWHVPTYEEWTTLTNYLGGYNVAGGKLKETGFTHWYSPNTGATNETGFTALPGGPRFSTGEFSDFGRNGFWWSLTDSLSAYAKTLSLSFFNNFAETNADIKKDGLSVRCLMDVSKPTMVTNLADNGTGSLRYAINYANSNSGVKDTITFNIPDGGSFTIQPLSPLPQITDPVVINGFTQPGASEANSILLIELNGTKAGTGSNGLILNAGNCTIKGIVIDQFSGNGIQIISGSGNQLTSNSIYSNGKLGIDLGGDGVTLNDNGDGDTGPNNFQNYPVLGSINLSTGSVTITGSLNSTASRNYNIQFFANKLANNSGYGEGQTLLGSTTVTTATNGNVSFTQSFSIKSSSGTVISATATDPLGNTSEFSKALGGLQNQTVSQWPLRYTLNADGVPNITDGSDLNAVRASFQTWVAITTATISFTDAGTTKSKYANANDGVNLVSFEDDQFPFSYGVLAVAAKTLKIDPTTQAAQIIDADIVVNPEFVNDIKYNLGVGYNNKNAGYFDIQSVITHEIGHVLGLLHSGVVSSTMFFTLGQGTKVRTLEQDDKSWVSYCYPSAAYNSTYGSISGNITYGYGGQPVAGALVYAINASKKDSVHTYSDASGNYLVPGLIPGSYYIYIEPLDGNVNGYNLRPGNISSYIYANTVYTDYPGEFYSGSSESNNEANDIQTQVSVSVGTTTKSINLITNQDHTPPFVVKARSTDVSGSLINILSNFSIRFSEPIDETTLSIGSCYLTAGTKTYGGSYTILGDSVNVIMFDPDSVLKYSTGYTLHVTGGVKDLKTNSLQPEFTKSFTTISADNIPPKVNEVIPANGATNLFVTDNITVFFSEPMNTTSVEKGFALTSGGLPIAGSFSWDKDNKSVIFTPSGTLKEGTKYTLTLPASITDLSGNPLASGQYSFNTVAQAAPIIVYYGPSGSVVPVNSPVVVDFSEPINTFTVNSSTFKLLLGSTPVQGTFEFLNENSRVIFRPAADLGFSQTYTVILTAGIMDVSQPSMKLSQVTNSFSTAAKATVPDILFLDPPSGVVGAAVTIAGSGFDPNPVKNIITFNGIVAPVKTATLSTLTTEVPLGAMSGPVQVSVNGTASDNTMYFYLIPQSLDPCSSIIANTSTGTKSTHGTDVTPDGTYAYVTNPDLGKVTAVNLNTLKTTSINVGNTPMNIVINPLGTRAYITNFNSHTVSVIDLVQTSSTYNTVIKTIPVGVEPYGIVVTPSGKRVYVANYYSGNLSMIDEDPSSGGFDHVVANVSTGTKTGNVAVTPDGAMVLVTGDFGLKIIDSNPKDKDYNSVIANVSTGTKTKDVTVTPDAGLAIVLTEEGNLLVVNLHPENGDYSEAIIANVSTGTKGSNVKGSGDGLFVYVTDTDHDQLLVYQIGIGGSGTTNGSAVSGLTLILHNKIAVGKAPEGLVINANSDRLYVIDTGVSGNREVTTVAICCGPITPAKAIGDLIISVQNMINNGNITKLRGYALIISLNSALRDLYSNKSKLAIADLTAFTALVNTYIKNKQITSAQGNALVKSANALITQLKGTKSALAEPYVTDNEQSDKDLISKSKLDLIYPNPSSRTITINYEIAEKNEASTKVQIMVYDINGRLVCSLVDKMMQQGSYTDSWRGTYDDGTHAPYGTYFVLFRAGDVAEVNKVMLIKPR